MATAKNIEGASLHFPVPASTKLGVRDNVEDDSTSESVSRIKTLARTVGFYKKYGLQTIHWASNYGSELTQTFTPFDKLTHPVLGITVPHPLIWFVS